VVGKSLAVGLLEAVLLSEVEVEDVAAVLVPFPNDLLFAVQVLFPDAGALAAEDVEEDVVEDVVEDVEKDDEILNQKQLNN